MVLDIADFGRLIANSCGAFFLLNERGTVVFANKAMEELLGGNASDDAWRQLLESQLLRVPTELDDHLPRMARRPWGEGKSRKWMAVTFIPVEDSSKQRIAVLGQVVASEAAASIEPARDAVAEEQLERLREQQIQRFGFVSFPARGEPMLRVVHQLKIAAGSDTPVAIVGEIGTGKESLARILHANSDRRKRNLAILDCRLLTSEQLKQELVGGEIISLGGVSRSSSGSIVGLLQQEMGGTLILLGVSHLPIELQELLTVEMSREEGPKWRLVVTDREPLETAHLDGRLTRSFYYLLSRFVIWVPPLRERFSEFEDQCQWVLERLRSDRSGSVTSIAPDALEGMRRYEWPGNLMELETLLREISGRVSKSTIALKDLPKRILSQSDRKEIVAASMDLPPLDRVLETVERRMVELSLRLWKGNKSKAAAALGISRQRLVRRTDGPDVDRRRAFD